MFVSKREAEILILMSQGLSSQEVSAALKVSIATVETHRKNIIRKLKVNNSTAAVAKAIRLKLID